jgi:hypothetical protein
VCTKTAIVSRIGLALLFHYWKRVKLSFPRHEGI